MAFYYSTEGDAEFLDNDQAHQRLNVVNNMTKLSNDGQAADRRGDYVLSASLHEQALTMKISAFGEDSHQAALSFNALGEQYLKLGRLEDAVKALEKALVVRERTGGDKLDAGVTRDNLGAVREAQGRFDEARDIRRKGGENGKKEMVCSWDKCMGGMKGLNELKACSACTAAFYCTTNCQKSDWKARHKVLCNARSDKQETATSN